MARQKGIITLEGTLGGINFYIRKGEATSRKGRGGFNSKAIKKDPNMVRVRENASEFGRVSRAKKLVRLGLHPFLKDLADVSLHGRMMTLFQQIKVLDGVSERGQRTFENGLATAEGRTLLLHFAITAQKVSTMLPGDGHFDSITHKYRLTNFKPAALRLPKGANGLQLCLGVLQADFADDTSTFYRSEPVYVAATFVDNTVTLVPTSLPTEAGLRIAVLQLRYYQEVNGRLFLFNELAAQGLEVVGVY